MYVEVTVSILNRISETNENGKIKGTKDKRKELRSGQFRRPHMRKENQARNMDNKRIIITY